MTLPSNSKELPFIGASDSQGAIGFLGVSNLAIIPSSQVKGQPYDFARSKINCWTRNEPFSWFMIDLGQRRSVLPTHYSLGYGSAGNHCCPRNWILQGSVTGGISKTFDLNDPQWDTLSSHVNDSSIDEAYYVHTWEVKSSKSYRFFRVVQTGKNKFKPKPGANDGWSDAFVVNSFEVYGTLFDDTDHILPPLVTPSAPPLYDTPVVPSGLPPYVSPLPPPYTPALDNANSMYNYPPDASPADYGTVIPPPVDSNPVPPIDRGEDQDTSHVTPPGSPDLPSAPVDTSSSTPQSNAPVVDSSATAPTLQQAPSTPPTTTPPAPSTTQTTQTTKSSSGQLKPCPQWDNCSQIDDVAHRDTFLHPCKYGAQCRNQSNAVHIRRFFHGSTSLPTAAPVKTKQAAPSISVNLGSKTINWKWEPNSTAIQVKPGDNTVATRDNSQGINPAILSSQMITKDANYCRIRVIKKGTWIGLGVVHNKYQISNSDVLGAQKDIINCGYFCQDKSRIQMIGEQGVPNVPPINEGDLVEIKVDFSTNSIVFANNGMLVGSLIVVKTKLPEKQLCFCANLSANSEIQFENVSSSTSSPSPATPRVSAVAPAPLPPPSKLCNHGASCTQTSDADHCNKFVHPCRYGSTCQKITVDHHTQRFSHPCHHGIKCRSQDNNSHCLRFSHDIPAALAKQGIKVRSKSTLQNPLENLPANIRWQYAPQTEVSIPSTKQSGKLNGWVMQDKQTKTGQLCIRIKDSKTLIAKDPSEVQIAPNPDLKPPWYHKELLVYESAEITKRMDKVLQQKVKGMTITFNQFFVALHKRGIPVYIIGGAVRDAIVGKEPKDIDVGFGVTSKELIDVANKEGWSVTNHTLNGLVQFGDNKSDLYLEGKSINGLNNDIQQWSNSLRSTGCDLHSEAIYRDFTINALCYDPINKVIIDPTGNGVEDAFSNMLRIPAEYDAKATDPYAKWNLWVQGNPTKLIRYWKFRARGYQVIDDRTRQFIIDKANSGILTQDMCNIQKRAVKPSDLPAFKLAVEADMGPTWFATHFG